MPPPPQATLRALAARVNARPLPPPRERNYGLRLPPEADCLTAANWQVKPSARQQALAAARAAAARQPGQQQQGAVVGAAPGGEGSNVFYAVRREQRIGMSLPGENWAPRADTLPVEPMQVDEYNGAGGQQQQQQQQQQQYAGGGGGMGVEDI